MKTKAIRELTTYETLVVDDIQCPGCFNSLDVVLETAEHLVATCPCCAAAYETFIDGGSGSGYEVTLSSVEG